MFIHFLGDRRSRPPLQRKLNDVYFLKHARSRKLASKVRIECIECGYEALGKDYPRPSLPILSDPI